LLDFNSGRELAVQMTRLNQLPPMEYFLPSIFQRFGFITGLNEQNIPGSRQVAEAGFITISAVWLFNPNLSTIDYPAFERDDGSKSSYRTYPGQYQFKYDQSNV
jgi:hypothetical protein